MKHPILSGSLLIAVVALGLALAPVAQAEIIYFDDFGGLRSANLNGTTPDITPTGSEMWTATGGFKADGFIEENWNGSQSASLPFVPDTGTVYTLSVTGWDCDPYGQEWYNEDSISAGFGNGPGFSFFDGAGRVNTNGPLGSVNEGNYGSGAISVKLVLDTRPTAWEAEWFVNDVSVRGPEAYASNPDITTVALGTWYMYGMVDSLTLEKIPEPSTLVLLATGLLGLMAYAWRKR
jgi:hypothetical protein